MWKRYLIEFGTGADLHGMDVMEAAIRAVKNAVSHCCMSGTVEILGIKDRNTDMYIKLKIGAPDPENVDPEVLKKLLITDNVDVEVVPGGLTIPGVNVDEFGAGDQIYIVNAGITVYVRV
jgi:uncharacterized protein (TIGR02058 family)